MLDNASSDGTVGALQAAYPRARVVAETTNLGFAKACNVGASLARGRYLGFFNSDCIARAGCVATLIAFLDSHGDVSVAVPRLVSDDRRVQTNVTVLPSLRSTISEYVFGRVADPYRVAELTAPTEVEACSGAALLIRRDDFWAVGGFYEPYFMYVEDVELCRQLQRAGKRIYYVPSSIAQHTEGASSSSDAQFLADMHARNREEYLRRTMKPVRANAAIFALRLGTAITPLRNKLLTVARTQRGRNGVARSERPELR